MKSDKWIYIQSCNDCGFYPANPKPKENPFGYSDYVIEEITEHWNKKHGGRK